MSGRKPGPGTEAISGHRRAQGRPLGWPLSGLPALAVLAWPALAVADGQDQVIAIRQAGQPAPVTVPAATVPPATVPPATQSGTAPGQTAPATVPATAPPPGPPPPSAAISVVRLAEDGFGTAVGRESIGIYGSGSVRGFSPSVAGNVRIEGMYFDQQTSVNSRMRRQTVIRVGAAAQTDPFPAPTGLVDIQLRRVGRQTQGEVVPVWGPFDSIGAEADWGFRLSPAFAIAAGFGGSRDRFANGGDGHSVALGVVPRWTPNSQVAVTAFVGWRKVWDETAPPIYIPLSGVMDAPRPPSRFVGPDWARGGSAALNAGAVGSFNFGGISLKAGLFRSAFDGDGGHGIQITGIDSANQGTRRILYDPPASGGSWSGEVRLSTVLGQGKEIEHLLLASVRGRSVRSRFGGGAAVTYGRTPIDAVLDVPRPAFATSPLSRRSVDQATAGVSWGIRWRGRMDLRFGLQQTRYEKIVLEPDGDRASNVTDATLPSVTLAIYPTATITLYASWIRGLEENGVAPDFAVNRLEALPALETRQIDAGVVWAPSNRVRVIVGVFEVVKPYITLDQAGVFGPLGDRIHRGVEVSVSTPLGEQTRAILAAVVQDPVVEVDPLRVTGVGRRPVGLSRVVAQLSVDHQLALWENVSVDASIRYNGSQPVDLANSRTADSLTTLSIGARFGFEAWGRPASLRVQVSNVTDRFQWLSLGNGVWEPLNRRAISAWLTTSF